MARRDRARQLVSRVLTALMVAAAMLGVKAPWEARSETNSGVPLVIAAGVPRQLAETTSDDELFAGLAAAGITGFLPFFQYQEIPEPKSLTREATFYPPCSPDAEPFVSMRRHGVRLVIPGQLLYAGGLTVEQGDAYLREMLACAGEGGVAAILSVDEPAHLLAEQDVERRMAEVRLIHERAAALAPGVPVVMVHAPLTALDESTPELRPRSADEIYRYFGLVAEFSAYADIVGFDLYAIPAGLAGYVVPDGGEALFGYEAGIPANLTWLRDAVPGKRYLMTLQAFGYGDLLNQPDHPDGRRPTGDEVAGMACASLNAGAEVIVWWGASMLSDDDPALWRDIEAVSARIANEPGWCDASLSSTDSSG